MDGRKRNASILHIVLGFFLILKAFDYYNYLQFSSFLPVFPLLVVATFSLFYGFFRRRIDYAAKYNGPLRLAQALTFVVYGFIMIKSGQAIFYIGFFIWAVLCFFMFFSERKIYADTIVYLDKTGIKIPGVYGEHLVPWTDIKDVVIRHDFVTIFHQRNKYLQFQVNQSLSELELAKIAAFCREEMEASEANNE